MSTLKTIVGIIILIILALFFFQNYDILTAHIQLKFYSFFKISIPIYYFFICFLIIFLLILGIIKLKYTFIINKKEKIIKKLEKEIDELRKLEISEVNSDGNNADK